jgi:hypothetical protein
MAQPADGLASKSGLPTTAPLQLNEYQSGWGTEPQGTAELIKIESRKHWHEDGIMVSFSKSIAVVASLTTIAVAAVAAVRYFDGMDGQIKDQRLLIETLQKELKDRGDSTQSPHPQSPSAPSLPAPASAPLQNPSPLPPAPAADEIRPPASAQ